MNPTEKFLFASVKAVNDDGTFEAVASTGALDRDHEIIAPDAWLASLVTFRTNPVLLACHQHRLPSGSSPVIGSAVEIGVANGELQFRGRFSRTPLGQEYKTLYIDKDMRAFSVGFIPQEGEWRDLAAPDGSHHKTWVHTKVDLLEISAVPVPANPEALARMRAAAAAGLDDQALADLADLVAAKVAETMKKALGDPKPLALEAGPGLEDLKSAIDDLKTEIRDYREAVEAAMPDVANDDGEDPLDPGAPDPSARGDADGVDEDVQQAARALRAVLETDPNP